MAAKTKRTTLVLIAALVLGSVVTACANDNNDDTIEIFAIKPENPLVPMSTTEVGGGRIVRSIFTGLTTTEPKSGELRNAMAESIETNDSQHYTIKIKKDWTFHDGTPVTAASFVKAWNYAAYTPNGQQNGPFFSNIVGFDQVHTIDPDQNGPLTAPQPQATEMSGLRIIDDHTFAVDLTAPLVIFPMKLSYVAFYPMPEAFFTNKTAYEKKPIGNGPFKVKATGPKRTELEWFTDYRGDDKAHVDKLTWRYYTNDVTAYRDVESGKLDFLYQVPTSQLEHYRGDFEGRNFDETVASIQEIAFPVYRPEYSDARVRQAISMSFDRNEIAETVLAGSRTAATGYVSPATVGFEKNQCGRFCEYHPQQARDLLAAAGGFAGEKIELWYNADGPHKDWMEAIAGQIQENLGIPTTAQSTTNFADIRVRANSLQFEQPFRTGWQAAYPSIENYLNPMFSTGGSSNDNGYSNPAVDATLAEADSATEIDTATERYREAERLILADMPVLPGFNVKQQSVWSDDVSNVVIDWKGDLVVTEIRLR